ncbi:MAG: hypothetical protein ACRD00_01410, partial [Thermoanaerobaculia bacterium]
MNRRTLAACAALALLLPAAAAPAAYSPATTNGWFTTAGRTAGGATHSDVWLFNPDLSAIATATLVFHPAVSSGGPAGSAVTSSVITLAARETRYFADVTSLVVPVADGVFGAIEWQSSLPLLGVLRNVSVIGGGTSGPIVAATPQSESMTPKASTSDAVNVLQLFGLSSGDANFTTRLDIANTSDGVLPIEARVIDPVTNIIYGGTQTFSIAPRSLLRVGNILQTVGAGLIDGLRITVAIREGTSVPAGGVIATATVTDGRTLDSYAVLGQRQSSFGASGGPCTPDAQSLCLSNGRFKVQAAWQSSTASGNGTAIPGTSDTGQFWFFSSSNVEIVVKVLNGCGVNTRYWV